MLFRQLSAIIRDTFRELLVRKVLLGFLILNALGLVGIAVFVNGGTVNALITASKQIAGPDTYTKAAGAIQMLVAGFFETVLTFVAIFTTASVVPTMLEKGTIDLYLSKPIRRLSLLGGKAVGSVAVVASNIALFIVGEWLILSIRLGYWSPGLFYAGLVMIFSFAVLYALVLLMNVLTRTSALGIIVAIVSVVLIAPLCASPDAYRMAVPAPWSYALDAFHYGLPQTSRLTRLADTLIVGGTFEWEAVVTGLIQLAAYFGLAGWVMEKKEF